MDLHTYLRNFPDAQGRFGEYGGVYLPDELVPAFEEITEAYQTIAHSAQFINELRRIRKQFQGRSHPGLPLRTPFPPPGHLSKFT